MRVFVLLQSKSPLRESYFKIIPVTWGKKKASANACSTPCVYLDPTAQPQPHLMERLDAAEILISNEFTENWQQALMPPLREKQEVSCYPAAAAWPKAHMASRSRCSAQAAGQRGSLRNEGVGGRGEPGHERDHRVPREGVTGRPGRCWDIE